MLHSRRSAGFEFADKVVFIAFIAHWVRLGDATQRISYLAQVVDQVLPAVESSQLCVGNGFANAQMQRAGNPFYHLVDNQ